MTNGLCASPQNRLPAVSRGDRLSEDNDELARIDLVGGRRRFLGQSVGIAAQQVEIGQVPGRVEVIIIAKNRLDVSRRQVDDGGGQQLKHGSLLVQRKQAAHHRFDLRPRDGGQVGGVDIAWLDSRPGPGPGQHLDDERVTLRSICPTTALDD